MVVHCVGYMQSIGSWPNFSGRFCGNVDPRPHKERTIRQLILDEDVLGQVALIHEDALALGPCWHQDEDLVIRPRRGFDDEQVLHYILVLSVGAGWIKLQSQKFPKVHRS